MNKKNKNKRSILEKQMFTSLLNNFRLMPLNMKSWRFWISHHLKYIICPQWTRPNIGIWWQKHGAMHEKHAIFCHWNHCMDSRVTSSNFHKCYTIHKCRFKLSHAKKKPYVTWSRKVTVLFGLKVIKNALKQSRNQQKCDILFRKHGCHRSD